MIRAVILDYFSVISPDIYEIFENEMSKQSTEVGAQIKDSLNQYYSGIINFDSFVLNLEGIFRTKTIATFFLKLYDSNIPPHVLYFAKNMHAHFLKVAIVGNIGEKEIDLLTKFDEYTKEVDLIAGPLTYGFPLMSEEFFKQALNDIGEPPEKCLLISKHLDYLSFGKKIGLKTYQFDNFNNLTKYIQKEIEAN